MELKKHNTYDQQLEKLISRDCFVSDPAWAKEVLQNISYYRLTGYFLPFKDENDRYIPDTSFHKVYRIYEFDRKLRGLLLSYIEEIEIMLRARLSYEHAKEFGEIGYLRPDAFDPKHNHEDFLKRIKEVQFNNRQKLFVIHHEKNYNGQFPLWVIIELFTFGMLSKLYADMLTWQKKEIARSVFHAHYEEVMSWLHCLCDLRNACAHYSRLYYVYFPATPKSKKGFPYVLGKRLFDYILVIKFLYPDQKKWTLDFFPSLDRLIGEYHGDIDYRHIGFPKNWRDLLETL